MSESKTAGRPTGRALGLLIASTLLLAAFALPGAEGGPPAQSARFENLRVLPPDATDDQVFGAMLENLRGLGLPRRDSEGCLYCHVGSMETPSDTWDYASDDKIEKRKARQMMAMVAAINEDHLGGLESRSAPELRVACATCHAGRTDPRPLPDILRAAYGSGGIDAVVDRYEELRERYFGADAYDFRPNVLAALASGLAANGAFDDAITLAELNARVYPEEASVRRTIVLIDLQRAYVGGGVEGAIDAFERHADGDRSSWLSYEVLDSLGWGVFRTGDEQQAIAIFRHNVDTYPGEYVPHESLADAHFFAAEPDVDEAIRIYEAWVEAHPDHEIARRRLRDIREQE